LVTGKELKTGFSSYFFFLPPEPFFFLPYDDPQGMDASFKLN